MQNPDPSPLVGKTLLCTGFLCTAQLAIKFGMGFHDSPQGDQSITLLSSQVGYSGSSLESDYTASRRGVRGLFRSLLSDGAAPTSPVRIKVLAPFFVLKPMTAPIASSLQISGVQFAPLEAVTAAQLKLLSDRSVHGRAIRFNASGAYDLRDDWSGGLAPLF